MSFKTKEVSGTNKELVYFVDKVEPGDKLGRFVYTVYLIARDEAERYQKLTESIKKTPELRRTIIGAMAEDRRIAVAANEPTLKYDKRIEETAQFYKEKLQRLHDAYNELHQIAPNAMRRFTMPRQTFEEHSIVDKDKVDFALRVDAK